MTSKDLCCEKDGKFDRTTPDADGRSCRAVGGGLVRDEAGVATFGFEIKVSKRIASVKEKRETVVHRLSQRISSVRKLVFLLRRTYPQRRGP